VKRRQLVIAYYAAADTEKLLRHLLVDMEP